MLALIFSVFVFCFLLERAVPGWRLPNVKGWSFRVLMLNAAQLGVVLLAGLTWERWFSTASLFHLSDHVSAAVGGSSAQRCTAFTINSVATKTITATSRGGTCCSALMKTQRSGRMNAVLTKAKSSNWVACWRGAT